MVCLTNFTCFVLVVHYSGPKIVKRRIKVPLICYAVLCEGTKIHTNRGTDRTLSSYIYLFSFRKENELYKYVLDEVCN